MSVKCRDLPADKDAARIVKTLAHITSTGQRPDDIFEDWLELVEASLDMLPAHLKSAVTTGKLAEDSPEAAQTWTRIRARYDGKRWVFERFSEAFGLLLDAAYLPDETPTYRDIVGDIFMAWGRPSAWAGQFFTPWHVARFMAEMVSDGGDEVHRRLRAAIDESPLAQVSLLAGLALEDEAVQEWLFTRVVPAAIEHYQPVTVIDPCVGSGVMLLAHASTLPRWMVAMGLVQYYGCDIDMTCVRMSRINCKLYGLNGSGLKWALELSPEELTALPRLYAEKYTQAQAAQREGDSETIVQIANEVRTFQQLSLFTPPDEAAP